MIKKLTIFILLSLIQNVYAVQLTKLQYHGFTLYMDCSERSVRKFEFTIGKDTGNLPRVLSFHYDPSVSLSCQQKSIHAYGSEYDLGHMVASNTMDSNVISEYESFSITNVLPQTKELNREAWYQTEKITECYRELATLKVIGGSILGNDRTKDFFVEKWGVKTPNYFWKVIIDETNRKNIAWILPNTHDAHVNMLDSYLVSIDTINKVTGENIKPLNSKTYTTEKTSWKIPKGCNLN